MGLIESLDHNSFDEDRIKKTPHVPNKLKKLITEIQSLYQQLKKIYSETSPATDREIEKAYRKITTINNKHNCFTSAECRQLKSDLRNWQEHCRSPKKTTLTVAENYAQELRKHDCSDETEADLILLGLALGLDYKTLEALHSSNSGFLIKLLEMAEEKNLLNRQNLVHAFLTMNKTYYAQTMAMQWSVPCIMPPSVSDRISEMNPDDSLSLFLAYQLVDRSIPKTIALGTALGLPHQSLINITEAHRCNVSLEQLDILYQAMPLTKRKLQQAALHPAWRDTCLMAQDRKEYMFDKSSRLIKSLSLTRKSFRRMARIFGFEEIWVQYSYDVATKDLYIELTKLLIQHGLTAPEYWLYALEQINLKDAMAILQTSIPALKPAQPPLPPPWQPGEPECGAYSSDEKLTQIHIQRLQPTDKWFALGFLLGVPLYVLNKIRIDYRGNCLNCFYAIMRHIIELNPDSITLGQLTEAVCLLNQDHVIRYLPVIAQEDVALPCNQSEPAESMDATVDGARDKAMELSSDKDHDFSIFLLCNYSTHWESIARFFDLQKHAEISTLYIQDNRGIPPEELLLTVLYCIKRNKLELSKNRVNLLQALN